MINLFVGQQFIALTDAIRVDLKEEGSKFNYYIHVYKQKGTQFFLIHPISWKKLCTKSNKNYFNKQIAFKNVPGLLFLITKKLHFFFS